MAIKSCHGVHVERIPGRLHSTYVRYKQDTREIISWLLAMSHGAWMSRDRSSLTIGDLMSLAQIVQKKAVAMPDTIDFHFREAIAARTQLSKYFRGATTHTSSHETTTNHEYFTENLKKMHSDLCKCCAGPRKDCKNVLPQNTEDIEAKAVNPYAILDSKEHESDSSSNITAGERRCDGRETTLHTEAQIQSVPRLTGDSLCDAFELRKAVQNMSDLLLQSSRTWEQAASGKCPILIAAFVSNVIFAEFEEVESRLKLLCDSSDPATLHAKCLSLEGLQSVQEGAGLAEHVQSLQLPWESLIHFIEARQGKRTMEPELKSSQITVRKGKESASMDRECFFTLVKNVQHHLLGHARPTSIVLAGTPLFAELGYFLTHERSDINGLRCSFGLQMLLDAYKGYLLAPQRAHPPSSCRLQGLRFAQEIASSVVSVLDHATMPCRCCQTLASNLEILHNTLKAYLQEKGFDLYFQSPWVCGSHMLEMLGTSFYFGLRLFSYRQYVASVLYVYHILRKLMGFREIALLEELCSKFESTLFPGGRRPTTSFKACYVRFSGGRLRFNHKGSHHRSGSHEVEIPVHTAKATAGFGLDADSRFPYQKISLLHHIRDKGYRIQEARFEKFTTVLGKASNKTEKHRTYAHHALHQNTSSDPHRLDQLQDAVLPEVTGKFPTARINFFKVYMACVEIVQKISNRAHGTENGGGHCLCFLDIMLTAADQYKANEHKVQPFGYKDLVVGCEESMIAVLGKKSLDEFLWKGI